MAHLLTLPVYSPFVGLATFCWAVLCNRFWDRREAELAYEVSLLLHITMQMLQWPESVAHTLRVIVGYFCLDRRR